MDRVPRHIAPCWIVSLCLVAALPLSRFVHGASNSHIPAGTPGHGRPQLAARQQPQVGARQRPVTVRCHPDSMEVVVRADLFDTGVPVDGRHLSLGPGPVREGADCGAEPSGEAEFTLRANLMDCGIKLSSTEEKIIYSAVLAYSPESTFDNLLRLDAATIPIECHYEKKYSVDVLSLQPTWVSSVSTVSADDKIKFDLLLMSDDWQFERDSSTYFLGDLMHFEVSAVIANHKPLRVFVDSCVATETPDEQSAKRYEFIENQGCFADAYKTNSNSRFLPRVEDERLRFQLEAFRFYQEPSHQVFITCHVKAVPLAQTISSESKACSLIDNRWQSVDGNDHTCTSCHLSHLHGESPITEAPETTTSAAAWPADTESSVRHRVEHLPATYVRFRLGLQQGQQGKPDEQSALKVAKRGANRRTEETIQLGPVIVLPSRTFASRSTDPKTASAKRKNV